MKPFCHFLTDFSIYPETFAPTVDDCRHSLYSIELRYFSNVFASFQQMLSVNCDIPLCHVYLRDVTC
jgi:hypothetical protein